MFGKLFKKTPLAWRQLMKEKTRLIVAIAGIGFADMLMFVQLGFQDSLYDSAVSPYRVLDGDLILLSPQFKSLASMQSFSRDRLYQAVAVDGVKSVGSVYISLAPWKNPETRLTRNILVWGVQPDAPSFAQPEIKQQLSSLKILDNVLFDKGSRPEYGTISDQFQKQKQVSAELSSQLINVSGIFTLGTSFVADGNVILSDSTFHKLFSTRRPDQIEIGLIRLKNNGNTKNIQAIQKQLISALPKDVQVLTLDELIAVEKFYWESQGTIGFIFGIGVIVGFIVGIVIVYQILYTDVTNHLPEYATLKAMGYSDGYLLKVLLQEAILLAILGYIPGALISILIYQLTYTATLLPIAMNLSRAIFVLIMTFIMCTGSGFIAMRKLRDADPADIF
jgi:putative ABC transport system permease protein